MTKARRMKSEAKCIQCHRPVYPDCPKYGLCRGHYKLMRKAKAGMDTQDNHKQRGNPRIKEHKL